MGLAWLSLNVVKKGAKALTLLVATRAHVLMKTGGFDFIILLFYLYYFISFILSLSLSTSRFISTSNLYFHMSTSNMFWYDFFNMIPCDEH